MLPPRLPKPLPHHPQTPPPLELVNDTHLSFGKGRLLVQNPWKLHALYFLLGCSLPQLVSHHPQPTQPTSEGGLVATEKGPKQVQLRLGLLVSVFARTTSFMIAGSEDTMEARTTGAYRPWYRSRVAITSTHSYAWSPCRLRPASHAQCCSHSICA